MNLAIIFFPPADLQRKAWFASAQPKLIEAWRAGRYVHQGEVQVGALLGKAAADEAFDLTNNPSRPADRMISGWAKRSLSVGDIVLMGDDAWLCASVGWTKIAK